MTKYVIFLDKKDQITGRIASGGDPIRFNVPQDEIVEELRALHAQGLRDIFALVQRDDPNA